VVITGASLLHTTGVEFNGTPASAHALAALCTEEGFATTALGLQVRRPHD